MAEPSSGVELVRRAFGAVTIPGDPEAMVAASHSDFEMHLVGAGGEPVYYVGASGIREFFRDVAQSWASFCFQATDVRDLGDRVLFLANVQACGRASGVEVEDRWAWIVELRAGKAASLRGFLDQGKALDAAGLSDWPGRGRVPDELMWAETRQKRTMTSPSKNTRSAIRRTTAPLGAVRLGRRNHMEGRTA
jgi:ketosteroid isomerase-like protein